MKRIVNPAVDHTYTMEYSSLKDAVEASRINGNLTRDELAKRMYSLLSEQGAKNRLDAIVDENSQKKADVYELIHLCKVTGRFDVIFFMCDRLGIPRPVLNQKPEPMYAPKKRKRK